MTYATVCRSISRPQTSFVPVPGLDDRCPLRQASLARVEWAPRLYPRPPDGDQCLPSVRHQNAWAQRR